MLSAGPVKARGVNGEGAGMGGGYGVWELLVG
jgi:hypothetical protein